MLFLLIINEPHINEPHINDPHIINMSLLMSLTVVTVYPYTYIY